VRLRNLLWLFVAIISCSCFAACGGDDDEPTTAVSADFKVTTTEITALKSGGTYTVVAQSSVQPTFTSSDSWVQVVSVANSGSKKQIWTATVNVDANLVSEDRSATITVAAAGSSAKVTVSQVAADDLYVSYSDIPETVPADGGSYNMTLLTNIDYKVTTSASWITLAETRSRAGLTEKKYTVTISANRNAARTATITIEGAGISTTVEVAQAGTSSDMNKTAIDIAKDIYAGWNIGNTLEAYNGSTPSETAWGNPKITETLIKSIKAAGFNAVRLPTAWDGYITDRSTYKISDTWLNRVDEIVNWCVENDLYVIVNIHWDGGWLEEHCTEDKKDANLAEQKALWTQIATKLAGYDEHLLFAGCNEPNVDNSTQMAVLLEYEQAFIDAVRATGGRNYYRTLIVQGPATDIDKTSQYMITMPKDVVDGRMMAEVHYYSPWQFCGMSKDESWGKMAYYWGDNMIGDSERDSSWGDLAYMQTEFKKMQDQFVSKGIPVILGEYGAIVNHEKDLTDDAKIKAHKQSRFDFNKAATREAKNHGMVPFMWDTGEGMNRSTGAVTSDVIIPAIMEGAAQGKYPF
jgi:aryl-phospho-beta-D-glucosidase BglC (GH1 family)